MNCHPREITLGDALADPLVRAVMAADGVDPRKLEDSLRKIGARLQAR